MHILKHPGSPKVLLLVSQFSFSTETSDIDITTRMPGKQVRAKYSRGGLRSSR